MGSIEKGILLIALGHENYMNMAINLAASIKYNCSDIPIAVLHNGRLKERQLFDHIIEIDEKIDFIKWKTRLYEISPFNKTLFLDVDMILFPEADLNKFFDELNGINFTIINAEKGEYAIWALPEDIRRTANNFDDPLYTFYSELIYFEKNVDTEIFFEEVKNQYTNPEIEHKSFSTGLPDELAYTIASLKLKMPPHKKNWDPVFWHFRNKKDARLSVHQLKNKYIALSVGGNQLPIYIKAHYNNLAIFYNQKMGIAKSKKVTDKRLYLIERAKI